MSEQNMCRASYRLRITRTFNARLELAFTFFIISLITGFNADLQAALVVNTEGWVDITGWRTVGIINGLYQTRATINKNNGRFLPSEAGMHVNKHDWVHGFVLNSAPG